MGIRNFFLTGVALVLAASSRAADMETYRPDEPGGEKMGRVISERDGTEHYLLVANFGIEEAQRARKLGRCMAQARYCQDQAVNEILRIAAETYPNDGFFARCFARQAVQAYAEATCKPASRFLC